MPGEHIKILGEKIDVLINKYVNLKNENEIIKVENNEKHTAIKNLERKNEGLKKGMLSLESITNIKQEKMDTAAARVQEIISRLETVEIA